MRKILLVAAPLALCACGQDAVEEPAVVDEAPDAILAPLTANGSSPGSYSVTAADGTQSTSILNADGTYQEIADDETVTAEGSWAVVEGKTCFTPTTEGVEAMCYTESAPGEDGSFTATPDEGEPVTVAPDLAGGERGRDTGPGGGG
jgi:hypothetical protein